MLCELETCLLSLVITVVQTALLDDPVFLICLEPLLFIILPVSLHSVPGPNRLLQNSYNLFFFFFPLSSNISKVNFKTAWQLDGNTLTGMMLSVFSDKSSGPGLISMGSPPRLIAGQSVRKRSFSQDGCMYNKLPR